LAHASRGKFPVEPVSLARRSKSLDEVRRQYVVVELFPSISDRYYLSMMGCRILVELGIRGFALVNLILTKRQELYERAKAAKNGPKLTKNGANHFQKEDSYPRLYGIPN
jgi:hypothetical protein